MRLTNDLAQDLRHTFRVLRTKPAFTLVAVSTLALGIGANTAIFTLIDQILLRKLPVKNPEELVMLFQSGPHSGSNMGARMHSYPIYQEYQKRAEPLQEVADRLLPERVKLTDLRWSSIFRISMRLAARYRQGNAFIAGDGFGRYRPRAAGWRELGACGLSVTGTLDPDLV